MPPTGQRGQIIFAAGDYFRRPATGARLCPAPGGISRSKLRQWGMVLGRPRRRLDAPARRTPRADPKAFIIIFGRVHREGRRQGQGRDEVILPLVKQASLAQRMGGWPQAG
jgi:hypothetical protein